MTMFMTLLIKRLKVLGLSGDVLSGKPQRNLGNGAFFQCGVKWFSIRNHGNLV